MEDECLCCKKHYTQSGKCNGGKRNCLLFDEEPGGKMIRCTVRFKINPNAVIPIVKPFGEMEFMDKGEKGFTARIIKINWVNMETGIISADIDYHEADMPRFEKKKLFKIIS